MPRPPNLLSISSISPKSITKAEIALRNMETKKSKKKEGSRSLKIRFV
jgi:hypothetical protein